VLSAVIWFGYLLAYDNFPLSFSENLYRLFISITAAQGQYWLFSLLTPLACVLPAFFFQQVQRYVQGGMAEAHSFIHPTSLCSVFQQWLHDIIATFAPPGTASRHSMKALQASHGPSHAAMVLFLVAQVALGDLPCCSGG
jgi:hypothetical protein